MNVVVDSAGSLGFMVGRREFTYAGKNKYQVNKNADGLTVFLFGEVLNAAIADISRNTDFSQLFGRFVIVIFSPNSQKIELVTDRYGLYPFFMFEDENRIIVGENPSWFGVAKVEHTESVLAELLAFDQPLGCKTYWKNVERLQPGSITSIFDQRSKTSVKLHWNKAALLANQNLLLSECRDQLLEYFLEGCALSAKSTSDCAVTLSGGIDSRLILAGMLNQGFRPQAWSTGVVPNHAITYAHDMAMLTGVDHHVIPLSGKFIEAYPDITIENCARNSGLSISSEAEAYWLRNSLPQGVRLLHGAFGELYKIDAMHYFPLRALSLGMSSQAGIAHYASHLKPRFDLRQRTLKEVTGISVSLDIEKAISERADLVPDLKLASQLGQWLYIDEFLQKVTGISLFMWSERCNAICPLSYPKFIDLLLRIRPEDRRGPDFALYALKKISPELAAYPDSNTRARIGASRQEVFARRASGWLQRKVLGSRPVGEHMDSVGWVTGMKPSFEQRMRDSKMSAQLNFENLNRLVRQCSQTHDSKLGEALLTSLMVVHGPQMSN
jgi:asparagine synthase (glutamine-hydrolysing)